MFSSFQKYLDMDGPDDLPPLSTRDNSTSNGGGGGYSTFTKS